MTHREIIGQQLAALRKEQGLTVRQLAERCGLDHANIVKIENGKYNVSIDILQRVCDALGANIRIGKEVSDGEA